MDTLEGMHNHCMPLGREENILSNIEKKSVFDLSILSNIEKNINKCFSYVIKSQDV